ncbi:helix-turn-helix domain-containing protein [Bdellovibrio bacteriovorus]|uniref:ArsR/SmtB family transcription factor n=1 Tax=Bdellovibrio bacteriovorus TaxID=959 RepID=UPI0021D0B784|nr:helix-turn-helix domain-containing protein [Bdellovibrio bacteriovorus]UXR63746.1 helix-turn-helix domain-containing protein [Bdellovibrio bacteriovorus]
MASPIRLRILQSLANSPSTVETLSVKSGESIANTSQHLQKMLRAGLLKCEKNGVSRIYSLANEKVLEMWLALQNLAFQLNPQIQQDEKALCPDELCTSLSLAEVLKLVKSGKAVLVDARELDDADGSPINGALHIPPADLKKNSAPIAKSKTVFVFCRGRYCTLANPLVEKLRGKGFKAFRLREMAYEIQKQAEEIQWN